MDSLAYGDDLDVSEPRTAVVSIQPTEDKPKWQLKKMTTRHRRIVQLKVAGLDRVDIAAQCKCTPEYISMLLSQDIVKAYLQTMYDDLDQDLKDLVGPAVNTMRTMLESPDDKVALTAATTVLRANGKLSPSDDGGGATAEDVVAKLFSMHGGTVNLQVNNYRKD